MYHPNTHHFYIYTYIYCFNFVLQIQLLNRCVYYCILPRNKEVADRIDKLIRLLVELSPRLNPFDPEVNVATNC